MAVLVLAHTLSVSASAQLTNDSCASGKTISATPYADNEVTTAATIDLQDPAPQCVLGPCADPDGLCRGKSVWYVFTAPSAGTVRADTLDSDYDTVLSAYTGSCGSLQPLPDVCVGGANGNQPCTSDFDCPSSKCNIGCNDDDPLDGAQSVVSIQMSSATTYHFMVSAFNNDGGNLVFHLSFLSAPNSATPTTSVPPTATPTPTAPPEALGDANCDGRRTAADLTALVGLIAANERSPCRLDDANRDGVLNADDIGVVVEALFEP